MQFIIVMLSTLKTFHFVIPLYTLLSSIFSSLKVKCPRENLIGPIFGLISKSLFIVAGKLSIGFPWVGCPVLDRLGVACEMRCMWETQACQDKIMNAINAISGISSMGQQSVSSEMIADACEV